MTTASTIIKSAETFYSMVRNNENSRYRSWEHCYKSFHDARNTLSPDCDYLSLQPAFYLASWGMYRGSSFLLQKDYKVHKPLVEELLKTKYDCLFGIDCIELKKTNIQKTLTGINEYIKTFYNAIRKSVKGAEIKNELSNTLITKVLMGTFGCVPAYDRYFISGAKKTNITTGTYNINSLLRLADFYEENREQLEKARGMLKVYDLPYPQMKLLDMGLWLIGCDNEDSTQNANGGIHS